MKMVQIGNSLWIQHDNTIKEKPRHVCVSVALHYTVGTSCPSIHIFPFQQLFFSLFILFLIFFSLEILLHSINKAITTKIITIIEGKRRRHRNDNGRRNGQNGARWCDKKIVRRKGRKTSTAFWIWDSSTLHQCKTNLPLSTYSSWSSCSHPHLRLVLLSPLFSLFFQILDMYVFSYQSIECHKLFILASFVNKLFFKNIYGVWRWRNYWFFFFVHKMWKD